MTLTGLIIYAIIGIVAGWIAGELMRDRGFGLVGNLVVGIVGAFIGGLAFDLLGVSAEGSLIGSLITATVGAVILLFIVSLVAKPATV